MISIVVLARFVLPNNKVKAAWWNETWMYRVAVNIGNTGGSNLTDFQVSVSMDTSALVTASKIQSDCDDIRVTDQTGKVLPYWVSGCNTTSTKIWPKISSIPTSGTTLYIYYGNSSASAGKTKTGTSDYPGLSCKSIIDAGDSTGNGTYWIDPTNGNTSDKFQAYCDMTNDSGGWMLVTQSMINSEVGSSTTVTKTNGSNNGLIYTTTITGNSCATSYGKFYLNDIIPWSLIKADYEFLGGNSCWSIFGNTANSAGTNLIPFALGTDTIRNQVKMGGSNGDNFDGNTNRCDNETFNFWHSNQGVGTTRSAQVISRRSSMASLAGLGIGTACVSNGYPWKFQNIYIKETTMTFVATSGSLSSEEFSPAPVGYWKFDEGNGTTTNDSSSNKNNGTISGATWASEDQCISGKCLQIGTSTASVNLGTNTALDANRDFSISLWIKPTSILSGWNRIYFGNTNDIGFGYQDAGSGTAKLRLTKTNNIDADLSNNTINLNQWSYATVTFNNTSKEISYYINGKFSNSATFNQTFTNSNKYIGYPSFGQGIIGYLDEFKIYAYVRTADQIKQDYNAGKSRAGTSKGSSASFGGSPNNNSASLTDGLVGYWKFDENSGNGSDSSGNNNLSTVSGSNNYSFGKFGNGFRSGIATTNFITNPSFETGISSWTYQSGGYGSATNTTTRSLFGNNSLMVTRTATGGEANVYNNLSGLANSTVYYYSTWAWANTASTACIFTYNGSSDLGAVCHSGSGNWERIGGTFTSTATGTIQLRLSQSSGSVLSSVYFDGAQVELGSSISPYLDGSMGSGYSWTGTANASTSIRTNSYTTSTDIDLTNQFTLSAWVKSSDYSMSYASPYPSIFNKSGSFFLACDYGGIRLDTIGLSTSSFRIANTCTTTDQNQWQHWSATYDGSKVIIYKNGVEIGRQNTSGTLTQNNNLVQIATNTSGSFSRLLTGNTDEVRIYNRALSASEITQLYEYTPGPIAYYNFEEKSGTTVKDVSGNNINISWTGTGSWANGKIGSAGNFNGSNSYLSATYTAPGIGKPFTMSAWMKTSVAHGYAPGIISFGYSPIITMQTDGTIRAWWYDGSSYPAIVSTKICNDGFFHYVTLSYDGLTAKLYVDGILQGNTNSSINALWDNLEVGIEKNSGNKLFNGQIDEAKFYNYARTQKQILEDMNGGNSSTIKTPVAWWKFDENGGTVTNNSGNQGSSLNGFFQGTPTRSTNGKFNKAISFDSSEDYISTASQSSLNPSSITISMWLYLNTDPNCDGNNNWRSIIYKGNIAGGVDGYDVLLEEGRSVAWDTGNGVTDRWWPSNVIIPIGSWTQLTLVYDEKGEKLAYLNGKLADKKTLTAAPLVGNSANFNLTTSSSSCPNGSGNFPGLMDDVKVYNYALSADEIKQDFNQNTSTNFGVSNQTIGGTTTSLDYCIPGDSSPCASPIAEWKMEEGTGTNIADSSGRNINGTFIGSPTWSTGKYGKSVSLNGQNNYVRSSDIGVTLASNYTIEGWVNISQMPGGADPNRSGLIGGIGCGPNYPIEFNIGGADLNNPQIGVGRCSDYGVTYSTGTFSLNTWTHIAVTMSPTKLATYYINGKYAGTSDLSTRNVDVEGQLSIGNNAIRSTFGKIDQVKIFDYARTPAQIVYSYNQGAPIAWWKLDECQGNIVRNSADVGTTGTITIGGSGSQTSLGTCTTSGTAWGNGTSGKLNGSLNFDGTDDYFYTQIIPTSSSFAISLWFKTTNIRDGDKLFWGRGTNKGILGFSGTSGNLTWYVETDTGTAGYTITNSRINLNQWNHVVLQYTGSQVESYINGIKDKNTNALTGSSTASAFNFGTNYNFSDDWFNGQLDDVRIYNYALTPIQVKNIYNNGAINFQ